MTRDGASRWAKRIKIEAVDTAMMAVMIASGRAMRGRSSVKMSPVRFCFALLYSSLPLLLVKVSKNA